MEFTGIWFVKDKLGYSNGLLIEQQIAIGMAIHMAVVLVGQYGYGQNPEGQDYRIAVCAAVSRVVVAVFFATAYFEIGNVIVAFVGVMGLKVELLHQPYT